MNAVSRLLVASSLVAASAVAQNLHPNADFDDSEGAEGWDAAPGFVHVQLADAADCPRSGSLVATSQSLAGGYELAAHGPCVAFAAPATVGVRLVYRGGGASPPSGGAVSFRTFSNGGCVGMADVSVGEEFQLVEAWDELRATVPVPAGGSLGVFVTGAGPDVSVVEIDEIRVTAAGYLFLDDFDGGGTCRWSSSVE